MACGQGGMPSWNGQIWAGSSSVDGIERRQEGKVIHCSQEQMDEYLAMTYQDFGCFNQKYVLNCAKWKKPNPACTSMSNEEVKEVMKFYGILK